MVEDRGKPHWYEHLTPNEAKTVARADAAKEIWLDLNAKRVVIMNRAVQRGKSEQRAKRKLK